MRNYCDLLKRSKETFFLTKSVFTKDDNILNMSAYLANCLKYNISKIVILKKNMHTRLFVQ